MIRAALYPRISSDRRDDDAGIERQTADGRALAAVLEWTIIGEYPDNDISASKGDPRPGYDAMMAAVGRREIDRIIIWQTSRLWRDRRERAEGIGFLAAHQVGIKAVKGPDLDLSTAYGRGMAGLLGEFDTMESEVKSERILRALQDNGEKGRPHGPVAYGWTREHDVHRRPVDVIAPAQAAIVREIAERILAGESIRGIVRILNGRGVPSPAGKAWEKNLVRAVVLRERNAGLRRHGGRVVGDGAWEPILELGTWEQVRAVLGDPARKTTTGTVAAHLLSGIARCGPCGGPVRAGLNRQVPSYRCGARSCVSRNRADVDAWVRQNVTGYLARFDPSAFAIDQPAARDAAAEAKAVRARMDLAADSFAAGEIDDRQLARINARLRPQLAAAQERARTVDAAPLLAGLIGVPDAADRWDALPLPRRRAVTAFLADVRIDRAAPGARTFDTATVIVTPRHPGG